MPRSLRFSLLFAAKLGLSALLLWVVLRKLDLGGIAIRLRAADWRWLAACLALNPVIMALGARRWQGLSRGLLSFGVAFRYCWIGLFFGSIVPGMVAGDLAKGVALAAKDARARDERLPVSILVDKLVGLWVLCIFFGGAMLLLLFRHPGALAGLHGVAAVGAGCILAGLAAAAAFLRPSGLAAGRRLAGALPGTRIRALGLRILESLAGYSAAPGLLLRAALLSAAIHSLNSLGFWLILRALGVPAAPEFAAILYPMLSILLSIPISVSGIGVRDAFTFALFRAYGLNPESGVAFSWLLLGISVPIVAVGGLIQLWEIFHRRSG